MKKVEGRKTKEISEHGEHVKLNKEKKTVLSHSSNINRNFSSKPALFSRSSNRPMEIAVFIIKIHIIQLLVTSLQM